MTAAVLLCSGGLDSTTIAYQLAERSVDFVPLFVDYGQHCAATEKEALERVLTDKCPRPIEVIDVSGVYHRAESRMVREADLWVEKVVADDLFLPYRNLLLITLAAAFSQNCGAAEVYAGFVNSNHAKEIDCTEAFFGQLEGLLANVGTAKLVMPFRRWTKVEVWREAVRLGVPAHLTYSCQARSVVPCGACPNCVDRLEGRRSLLDEWTD